MGINGTHIPPNMDGSMNPLLGPDVTMRPKTEPESQRLIFRVLEPNHQSRVIAGYFPDKKPRRKAGFVIASVKINPVVDH